MPIQIKMDKQRKVILIELPLEKARPSASGKNILIATTHGLIAGTAKYRGRPITVIANAFVYPDQSLTTERRSQERPRHREHLDLDRQRKVSNEKMKIEKASATKRGQVRNVEP
jgi:hypothetical protein